MIILHAYRSHSVFIVHVKQRDEDDSLGQGLTVKINLVDLAGSERQGAAGTEGQTLREGAYINKRLFLLNSELYSYCCSLIQFECPRECHQCIGRSEKEDGPYSVQRLKVDQDTSGVTWGQLPYCNDGHGVSCW